MGIEIERALRACLYGSEHSLEPKIIFDSIDMKPELLPYFERLDKGDKPNVVIRDYANKFVKLKKFTVSINGKDYPIIINSKFKGKAVTATSPSYSRQHAVKTTKRILICLANLDQVLVNGEKTRFVPSSPKKEKHKGDKWIYAREFIQTPGLRGPVVAEILFPNQSSPSAPKGSDRLYHTTVKGAVGFRARNAVVEKYLANEGEVKITL